MAVMTYMKVSKIEVLQEIAAGIEADIFGYMTRNSIPHDSSEPLQVLADTVDEIHRTFTVQEYFSDDKLNEIQTNLVFIRRYIDRVIENEGR